ARWKIGFLIAASMAIAFVYVNMQTPLYRADTKILIEARDNSFTRPVPEQNSSVRASVIDRQAILSQVQILDSRDVASRVIQALDLGAKDEFNQKSLISSLLHVVGWGKSSKQAEDALITKFSSRLGIARIKDSRVIEVDFSSQDPELAARVVDAVVADYLSLQSEAKNDESKDATRFLEGQIQTLRTRVKSAESRVVQFRTSANLISGVNNVLLDQQQLTDLNANLSRIRSARSEAEGRAEKITSLLRSGASIDTVREVVSSQLVQRLREQELATRNRIAELSATLLSSHPKIKTLKTQLNDLSSSIRSEVRKIRTGFANDAKIASGQENALVERIERLKIDVSRLNEQEIQLRAFEREAAAERQLLESYLGRYREAFARQNAGVLPPDARVISRATVPASPYSPRKFSTTVIFGILAALLSVIYFVLGAFVSGKAFRPIEYGNAIVHVDEILPTEVVETELLEEQLPEEQLQDERWSEEAPVTRLAEPREIEGTEDGYQDGLYSAISTAITRSCRRIVIFDGRENIQDVLAFDFARQLADEQESVIVLDLDGVISEETPGAIELLDEEATFSQVIYRDRTSKLHYVPVGDGELEPEDMSSPGMRGILAALKQTYKTIIVIPGPQGFDADGLVCLGGEDVCAVVLLDAENINTEKMGHGLKVAGFSEVAFVSPVDVEGQTQAIA
ncbi:MAG: hypothetical protein JKY49_04730, partial [Cohaesibacteraceae bacterium]|nr:hypothetical protein [Cohaesibacteraceae bacterium]